MNNMYFMRTMKNYSYSSFIVFFTVNFLCVLLLLFVSCDWPYAPEKEPYPKDNKGPSETGSGTVYATNSGQQICNPSISQDDIKYPGCMLWLGFSGVLNVNVPDTMPEYNTTGVLQHDRLTITDTSNTVRWYIMRKDMSVPGELQDPQWSTHPDYIACLGEVAAKIIDGYAIRISDKASLKFCEDKMDITSTPHLWLPDSITSVGTVTTPVYGTAGLITKECILQFFGTTNVKIVYSLQKNGLTIFYVDYNDSIPRLIQLSKPENKQNWDCESPIISPDGNWIAFNCKSDLFTYGAYIQRLTPNSSPILVSEKASDPQWWINKYETGNPYYIIYTQVNGSYAIGADLSDPAIDKSGSAGKTIKQKLKGSFLDVPAHMGLKVDESSPAQTIAGLPFRGGLSRNGRFLCTGYLFGYILRLK